MAKVMLTTIDNPYDPFRNFDEWFAFDMEMARKENRPTCCGYLARMSMSSDDISEDEFDELNENVIDDIVKLNLGGKFLKISEEEAKALK